MNNKVYDRHSCLSPSFYSSFGQVNTTCRGNPSGGTVTVIPILGSPGLLGSHKATRAALATCPKGCCLSSALCTNRITSPCLYLAAREVWEKVRKCLSQLGRCSIRQQQSDTFFTLPQHSGIGSQYFKSYFKVEEKNGAFVAILVPLLKTIPSSNWVALMDAQMMHGCARWKMAAANMSHRDKSWHWLLDLTLPWTKSVWCTNIPALLFPVCPFGKKSVPAAALKIIYSTVCLRQGEAETANGGSGLPSQDIFNYRISKFQSDWT